MLDAASHSSQGRSASPLHTHLPCHSIPRLPWGISITQGTVIGNPYTDGTEAQTQAQSTVPELTFASLCLSPPLFRMQCNVTRLVFIFIPISSGLYSTQS